MLKTHRVYKKQRYIDEVLKETSNNNEYYMNFRLMGKHTLKIITYDHAGNTNEYNQVVKFFNLFGDK